MKYIVGYPVGVAAGFIDTVIANKDKVEEVYFSFGDNPSGRSGLSAAREGTPLELQLRQMEDLRRLSKEGIALNLLYNANCYGAEAQSRVFFERIGDLTDYLGRELGLASVTTASPLVAKFIKSNFSGIDVRASVNMGIGTPEGLGYVKDYFDSLYVKRELNRDMAALGRMKAACDSLGKQMYLLANSGCLNYCSAHTFHDNLVAHEAEIAKMDNGYQFVGVCREFLATPEGRERWLSVTSFIRPEDMHLYEGTVSAVKLATRVNPSPERILNAYFSGSYRGELPRILEPDHSDLFHPTIIDNTKIDNSHTEYVLTCNKRCESCGRCADVLRRATVTLGGDNVTVKV